CSSIKERRLGIQDRVGWYRTCPRLCHLDESDPDRFCSTGPLVASVLYAWPKQRETCQDHRRRRDVCLCHDCMARTELSRARDTSAVNGDWMGSVGGQQRTNLFALSG